MRKCDNPKTNKGRKNEVFDLSGCECQACGYNKDIRMLDIHHIDEDSTNNSWDNLSCLCVWCHQAHHRGVEVLFDLDGIEISSQLILEIV